MKTKNVLALIALFFIILTLFINSFYPLFAGFAFLAYITVTDETKTTKEHENNSI